MRLAAIYIKEHYLFEEAQTINFGGAHFYKFKKNNGDIHIEQIENKNYIDNFFDKNISQLSAVVGANGTGKTTIMSIINKTSDYSKTIFLYETNNKDVIIENRTGEIDGSGNPTDKNQLNVFINDNAIFSNPIVDIPILYYTPIADIDLIDFNSPISKTNHFKSTLFEFHLDNVERNTMFMTDHIIDKLRDVFPDLPSYNLLSINAKPLQKRDLRNIYGGFEESGEVESIQKITLDILWGSYISQIENKDHLTHDSLNFTKNIEVNILSYLIIDGTSMITSFNGSYPMEIKNIVKEENFQIKLKHFFLHKIAFIDKYIYQKIDENIIDDNYNELLFLFESDIFDVALKSKEESLLNIFTELLIELQKIDEDDMFNYLELALNNIIRDELEGKEFERIRENLIGYLDLIHGEIDADEKDIRILVSNYINDIIKGVEKSFEALNKGRFEIIDRLKESTKQAINLFASIKSFYITAENLKNIKGFELTEGNLNINLNIIDFEEFKKLINRYKSLVVNFNSNSVINAQILEFKPDKKLSYGEKSILNLFSSLYEFTLNKNHYLRQKNRYLLLLDESDLGFHPLWKRKYIQAINEVIPLIFSRIKPKINSAKNLLIDNPDFESPEIQIIVSTHDPLTLSDIPNYNITYLDKVSNDKSKILNVWDERERPNKSFGANITDLLSASFFVDDGLIGDFAKGKINGTIKWLNDKKRNVSEKRIHEQIINLIDEPVLQFKLKEMYDDNFLDEMDREYKEKELKRIAKKYNIEIDIKKEI